MVSGRLTWPIALSELTGVLAVGGVISVWPKLLYLSGSATGCCLDFGFPDSLDSGLRLREATSLSSSNLASASILALDSFLL